MTIRTRTINRRYRLERRITLTETTETWLGFDNVLHRAVAVVLPRQEMLRDGPFLVRFLQRSRIATALHHRCIVAAFDSGEDGDLPYLVTEYLGGESLTEIIRSESPFDVDDVAILIDQLAGALDYAHQRGFAHGDLTAASVVVDRQGAAKVLGLGLTIGPTDSHESSPGRSSYSIEGDIAALGALAFEMLTGEEVSTADPDSSGEAYLIDPDIPRNASDIVAIALGGGYARFGSAGAFAGSLSEWRSFDPGEFFVAPKPVFEWPVEAPPAAFARTPGIISEEELDGLAGDSFEESTPLESGSGHRFQWIATAVLILAIAASVIVWRSSEPSTGANAALPAPVEVLAQLSGF